MSNPISPPVTTEGGALSDLVAFLKTVRQPGTWIRLGFFFAGGVMIVIGIIKMTGDNKLSEGTKGVAKAAVKAAVKVKM